MDHLTKKEKKIIREIINTWPVGAKFTWNLIIEVVQKRIRKKYSRQALARHDTIQIAYQTRNNIITKTQGRSVTKSMSLRDALETIEKLEGRYAELKALNNELLAQFARWTRNADARGLSFDVLNQPLPPRRNDEKDDEKTNS